MADPAHRLAAHVAMQSAMDAEQQRQDSLSPLGGQGTSAGVTLSDAAAQDLAALGMSPDVEIPVHGPMRVVDAEEEGE